MEPVAARERGKRGAAGGRSQCRRNHREVAGESGVSKHEGGSKGSSARLVRALLGLRFGGLSSFLLLVLPVLF